MMTPTDFTRDITPEWRAASHRRLVEEMRVLRAMITRGHRLRSTREYRALRAARTPAWANRRAIAEVYRAARTLSRSTGVAHQVDHVVPLRGKLVSGLHVENNLQVLTRTENGKKRNSFEVQG